MSNYTKKLSQILAEPVDGGSFNVYVLRESHGERIFMKSI